MLKNQKIKYLKSAAVITLLISSTWLWQFPGKLSEGGPQGQTAHYVDNERYNIDESIRRAERDEWRLQLNQLKKEMQAQTEAFAALSNHLKDQTTKLEVASVSEELIETENQQFEPVSDLEQLKIEESEQIDQVVSALEDHISQEAYDSQWQSAMQDTIYKTLETRGLENSQLVNLVCYSSLCRLDFQHKSPETIVPFLNRLIKGSSLSNTEVYYYQEQQPDGNMSVKYYISRDGHSLPTSGF